MNPTTLAISPYKKGGQPLALDMALAFEVERRIGDIAYANKQQAKELFATFTRAYVHCAKLHAMVKLHVARATTEARKRRAILLLDHIPEMAKAKGLASARNATGSEDVRNAFYYTDEEYLLIEEGRAALEAAETLLFGKMMAFKDAAAACSSMLSPDERPRMNMMDPVPGAHGTDPNADMVERGVRDELDVTPSSPSPTNAPGINGFDDP